MPRRRRQRERQKINRLKRQKSISARALRFFVFSLPSLQDYDVKTLISRFMEDVNKWRGNFLSLSELGYGREELGSRRVRLHWNNRDRDWKNVNSFFKQNFRGRRRRGILNL